MSKDFRAAAASARQHDGPVVNPCAICTAPTPMKHFCHGCQRFVCAGCDVVDCEGKHLVGDHVGRKP